MHSQFRDFEISALAMFTELDKKADKKASDRVRQLIEDIRRSLCPSNRQLGPWETHELCYADHALDGGFLKLALISVGKALAVHQLSPLEYEIGFKAQLDYPGRSNHMDARVLQEESAKNLVAEQQRAAVKLKQTEESAATKLELVEEETAEALNVSQEEAAIALTRGDSEAAEELIKAQAIGLAKLETDDLGRKAHQHGLEQALAWMSGGYSVDTPKKSTMEDPFAFMNDEQKSAAVTLKVYHTKTANDLKEKQAGEALVMKEAGKLGASRLKEEQRQTAIQLSESQIKQASGKKANDEAGITGEKG